MSSSKVTFFPVVSLNPPTEFELVIFRKETLHLRFVVRSQTHPPAFQAGGAFDSFQNVGQMPQHVLPILASLIGHVSESAKSC